ncbi:MAG: TIR domain-containing protein [Methylococcales bacterium]
MNVFVSYSRRDGVVTTALLSHLHSHLADICKPFIHALEEPEIKYQQLAVFRALFSCHLIILLVSPASVNSPWVRLEIFLGRLLLRPIVTIDALTLSSWR